MWGFAFFSLFDTIGNQISFSTPSVPSNINMSSCFNHLQNDLQHPGPPCLKLPGQRSRLGYEMRGQSSALCPGEVCCSRVSVRLAVARGAWREACGHIAYKSPGHRYTEHCLATATAPLSEDSMTRKDTDHTHTWTSALVGKGERGESSSEDLWLWTVSLCGSRTAHEVPSEAVNQN